MNVAIDTILDEISRYSLNDKEMILDIVRRRLVEEKRERIHREYKKATKDHRSGKTKTGSVDDLFNSLNG